MKTVTFQNNGVIDPLAIATFGVNAKASDNPIGYFGTGLKYAIAVLLRDGCDIIIHAGRKKYTFTKQKNTIRDQVFNIVMMNNKPLGFTTELGKGWEMWQAFRELYCNALDEDGSVTDDTVKLAQQKTTVTVLGAKFHDCYLNRGEIVLGTKPVAKNEHANIHANKSSYVYYKGVRIYDGFQQSMYTYNVNTGISISEDRSAKYNWELTRAIGKAIMTLEDPKLIESILLAENNTLEHNQLDYGDVAIAPSETFLEVAESLRLARGVNTTIYRVLAQAKRLPPLTTSTLTGVQEMMLKKAVAFCKRIGYQVDVYPIVTSEQLKSGLLGLAQDKTIYLSLDTYGYGTKYLAATLIEEYLHLSTGYADMTRELQNHLFNDIVSLGEQVIGEPV